ncbi:C6 transcription factor [Xylariales sp. PMI_506]|nr:C6 transcription factor [Xylariales sp. PMI_506]
MAEQPAEPQSLSDGRHKRPRLTEGDRRRAFRACESCRKQKERCEGGFPCNRCSRLRRACRAQMTITSVDDSTQNRALRLGEAEYERSKLMEQILSHFIGDVPRDINELRIVAESIRGQQPKLSGVIGNEEAYDSDDSEVADESFTAKEMSENSSFHYSGDLSHWNFSKRVHHKINSLEAENDQHVPSCEKEYSRTRYLQSSGPTALTVARWFPPQPVAEFLIAIFFKYGQTNYFYVEENWVITKLESIYNPISSGSSDDAPIWCILLMLLAIGTQFVDLDSTQNQDKSVDHSSHHSPTDEDGIGITLYKLAVKLIPDVLAIATQESVQAFLLLGIYTLPLDTSGLSYTYLGVAIKIAIQNGMHRRYSGDTLDDHALEVRKRLWWTVYTLEKRICILHGRPLSISSSDIDVTLPTDLPHFKPSNFENFRAIIMLTPYLEAVASTIIRLRNSSRSQQTDRLDELVRFSDSLKEWWACLPSDGCCKDLDPQKRMFRANVHLSLAFLLTQVFMGRPFLFTHIKVSGSPGSKKSKASTARHTLASDCIEAAYQILDLCQLLNDHGGMARASYIEFSSCQAALLVFIAHSLNENTKRLRNCLANGMNLMRLMTRDVDLARSEFSIIELLERAISRLDAQSESQARDLNQQLSGYEQFKSWAQLWKQQSPQAQPDNPETTQHLSDTRGTTEITGFLWPPTEMTMSNFAFEPFLGVSHTMSENDTSQPAKQIFQPSSNLNFENLGSEWMGYQMPG